VGRQRRERLSRCEAIVIGRLDLGEADRIFTLMSRERGKIRVIAKGVRRPSSRMAPHLEYFTRCRLMLAQGRDLDVVTSAETIVAMPALRTDLGLFGHASYAAEMLSRLTEDEQELPEAFGLLAHTLSLLGDGVEPSLVLRHFDLGLFTLLGFRPELYRCVVCRQPLVAETNALSGGLGGMVCPRCRHADLSAPQVSVNGQKLIRTLDRDGLAGAATLRPDSGVAAEVERAFALYARHLLDRDLATPRVVRAIQEGLVPAYGTDR
jgi:DNA repair protein RecO (recombination protein O)